MLSRSKVGKHFEVEIAEHGFTLTRDEVRIRSEASPDGLYVIRSNVPEDVMTAEYALGAYKGLSAVKRAFRGLKTSDLEVRPVHNWSENRVRAHVFLCMLAWYVEWYLRRALAPLLFEDDARGNAELSRRYVVSRTQRSEAAKKKAATRRAADDLPVPSFRTVLKDFATLTRNRDRLSTGPTFDQLAPPTPLQAKAFELLEVLRR